MFIYCFYLLPRGVLGLTHSKTLFVLHCFSSQCWFACFYVLLLAATKLPPCRIIKILDLAEKTWNLIVKTAEKHMNIHPQLQSAIIILIPTVICCLFSSHNG